MGYILDQNLWESRDHGAFLLINQVLDSVNSQKAANPFMWKILEANKGELEPLELLKSLAELFSH